MADENQDIASPAPAEDEGITAYHGSPHEFERFDTSKIGTGSGAQAYGHGIYLAKYEPIAKKYRDSISEGMYKSGDKIFDSSELEHLNIRVAAREDLNKALERANSLLNEQPQNEIMILNDIDKINEAIASGAKKIAGNMYEVKINANPDHFLDWDKKFSNQSEYVKDAIMKSGIYNEYRRNLSNFNWPSDTRNKNMKGENLHSFLMEKLGRAFPEKTSDYLASIGIKGIKYRDDFHRYKGKVAQNYVVFDDKLLDIKRRYEMGGAVPMASGGETGDTQSMPQLTSEQQSLLDQLSRAIDRVYPAMDAAEARQPVIRHEPTMPGEPALTREQHQEYNIGQLRNALARIPTDYPTGPIGYAEGGDVGDNPAVQKALALTSGVPVKKAEVPPFSIQSLQAPDPTAKFKGYKFASLDEGEATTQKLAEIVKNAIDRHISLPPNERVQNSLKAIRALEPYLGKRKDGSPIAIIGKNSKLEKSMKGYKGGEPITLPDGRGIETTGISMFPAYKEENFSLCPNSASCEKQCLGKYSGNFYALGGGQDPDAIKGPRRRAYNRTIAFLREPEAFAIRAFDDIDIAKRQAAQYGNHLGVRMNVLSDIHPEVYRPIMENHPDVSFYDYTKMAYRRILPNHHLTYSSTGLTQDDVQNPWTNWGRMRRVLDRGDNVAMVFTNKQRVLPSYVHDTETGKRYKVIDGRTHDFRPLDSLSAEPGTAGMIVGLSNLKAFGSREKAHRDSKGFFVKYDPQKDGDSVKVIPQGKGMTGMNNDGKVEKEP